MKYTFRYSGPSEQLRKWLQGKGHGDLSDVVQKEMKQSEIPAEEWVEEMKAMESDEKLNDFLDLCKAQAEEGRETETDGTQFAFRFDGKTDGAQDLLGLDTEEFPINPTTDTLSTKAIDLQPRQEPSSPDGSALSELTIVVPRGASGFGMNIDPSGTVSAFSSEDSAAKLAGVPLKSTIVAVAGNRVSGKAEIVQQLRDLGSQPKVSFTVQRDAAEPGPRSPLAERKVAEEATAALATVEEALDGAIGSADSALAAVSAAKAEDTDAALDD